MGERYADGFTADTPQLGWSMSKSVTNLLAGRLALEGTVAPQDHDLPQLPGDKAAITVDDLMRMTSGLSWDETYDLGTPITRMLFMEPDMGSYVASLPVAHAPGAYQQYSSGSTTLLCDVLGEKAGAKADLPRRELLAPLGLSRATWEPDASGTPVCGSYLWATPREWATIGWFALNDGVWNGRRMLPEGWMARSTTAEPVEQTQEDEGYGAGWWLNTRPDGSPVAPGLPADAYRAVGHDGQRVYVVPSEGLVVVRMGFSPSADDLRTDALVADVIAALR
ncbi:serine hydrolase domain-containing protein [Propioniciclava coleopterorum]|uniref:serine hydrolase domain-containing protein n=1 Tax=Propioniciclava coleopterorum TaxID=2714937 RepID=UPI001FEC5F11|nr:serine hydrolase [Propioniciclava coleopterorum]